MKPVSETPMFCCSAIVRCASGRSGCGSNSSRVWSSYIEPCFGLAVNSAKRDVTGRTESIRRASRLSKSSARLQHRVSSTGQIVTAFSKHQTAAADQLFSGNRTAERSRDTARRVVTGDSSTHCSIRSLYLAVVGDSFQGKSSDRTSFVLTGWTSSLTEVGTVRSCGTSRVHQYPVTLVDSVLRQQCREFSTSSSARLRLSTVGSQSSKKGPVEGPKPDPPVFEAAKDVTDKMNVPEPVNVFYNIYSIALTVICISALMCYYYRIVITTVLFKPIVQSEETVEYS